MRLEGGGQWEKCQDPKEKGGLPEKSLRRSCHLRCIWYGCPSHARTKEISTVSADLTFQSGVGSLDEQGHMEPRSITPSLPPWTTVLRPCLGTLEVGTCGEWHP